MTVTEGMLRMWVLCTKGKNILSHLVLRSKNKGILLHTNFSEGLTRHTVVRNLQDPTEDPLLSLDLSSCRKPVSTEMYAQPLPAKGRTKEC